MKKIMMLFFAASLLASCVTQQTAMNSWVGASKQQLILSWGPPDRVASDGGTGEILVYARQGYIPPRTFYDGYGGSTTTPGQTYWDYKFFWVNASGIIYYWKSERRPVPPMQIDLNIYKRY